MKAEMALRGIKSTIHPQRTKPIKQMIAPAMIATAEATTCPGMSGWLSATLLTMFPVRVDMTATGCRQLERAQGYCSGNPYSDSDILRRRKEPIDQNTHER